MKTIGTPEMDERHVGPEHAETRLPPAGGSKPAKGATEPHERCRAQGEVGCFTTPGQAAKVRNRE